ARPRSAARPYLSHPRGHRDRGRPPHRPWRRARLRTRHGSLLAEMRARSVAVEVCLTSTDLILGVRSKNHPLPAYLAAGVPVEMSSDDAVISRIDLTNEYVRAARDYGLEYRVLKAIARNALIHSFLDEAQKRGELARFDRAGAEFERSVASRQSPLQNAVTLIKAAVTLPP